MTKHTQGPWRVGKGKYGYQIWQDVKKGFGNHWIANLKCESCPADALPNAHLIAAAPELLEALESFPGFLCGTESGDAWIEHMRAAIAKARGEA